MTEQCIVSVYFIVLLVCTFLFTKEKMLSSILRIFDAVIGLFWHPSADMPEIIDGMQST
jgi:hypothetical protein